MEKLTEVKQCTKCDEVKELMDFYRNVNTRDGYQPHCKVCHKELVRKSKQKNKDKHLSDRHNKRAKRFGLPAELTPSLVTYMREEQQGRCILTGIDEGLQFEHTVPLSKGGGSTFENCYFINEYLNWTMNDKNMFEWIKHQHDFVKLRFYNVFVPMMAERNGMTPKEYEAYVYSHYENNVKEIG
ncbi:hypothetical protein [Bacillus subtilis]|uniref:hypothetical protein n=1 Tax=Bacillus subtilis TaxID=1423 RepID=UPI002676D540|nr:hypothetical protein [Bacillus subtilis]MDO3653551.1 hypothetical protein [Bacillus subtilis]